MHAQRYFFMLIFSFEGNYEIPATIPHSRMPKSSLRITVTGSSVCPVEAKLYC